MKREKLTRKQLVEKRIEFRNKQLVFIEKKGMDDKDRQRVYGEDKPEMSRLEMRTGIKMETKITQFQDLFSQPYTKKVFVDYDVVICIPSNNRYEKVKRMLWQFYHQPSKYTFKIILLDDGSSDLNYDCLLTEFPDLVYIKNDTPNGLLNHWRCYNQLWEKLKTIHCHAVLQMDDDFILCNGFLNKIVDKYFREKQKNNHIVAVAPHTWSFKKSDEAIVLSNQIIDGIGLFDIEFIKALNYSLNPVVFNFKTNNGNSAGVWAQLNCILKKNNCYVYRTEYSLVWHDGNEDSPLHGEFRRKRPIYTQNYIDDNLNYD